MPRWARKIGGVAAALLLGLAASPSWGQTGGLAIAVKATYLVKFGSFVVWPAEAFPAPTSPFTICTAGTDGFGDLIDRAAAGQIVGDHRITVRHGIAPDCQILYVGGDASLLDTVAHRPVLTVTDLPDWRRARASSISSCRKTTSASKSTTGRRPNPGCGLARS